MDIETIEEIYGEKVSTDEIEITDLTPDDAVAVFDEQL